MTRFLADLPASIPSLYAIDTASVFRRFPAPLRLQLSEGAVFLVSVDASQSAITLRDGRDLDVNAAGFRATLEATDPVYADADMHRVPGTEITGLCIVTHPARNLRHAACARESLGLALANGRTLLLSCGLHDESDDFSILYLDEVPSSLRDRLTSTAIE